MKNASIFGKALITFYAACNVVSLVVVACIIIL